MAGAGIRSIARNTGFTLVARAWHILSRMLYLVVVARSFGPEIYGGLAYAQSLYMMLLFVFVFGFKTLLSQHLGLDKERGAIISREILAIRLLLLGLVFTILILSGWLLHHDPLIQQLIFVMAIALVGRALSWHCMDLFNAYERTDLNLKPDLSLRSAEFITAIVVALLFHDILLVGIVHAISWLVQGVVSFRITRKHFGVHKPLWNWTSFPPIIRTAAPLALAMTIGGTQLQWTIVAVKHLGDTAAVGNTSILINVMVVLSTFAWSLSSASIPVLTRSVHREDGNIKLYILTLLRGFVLGGILLFVCGEAISSWLCEAVFGRQYPVAIEYAHYPLILFPAMSLSTTLSATLLAMSRYWTIALVRLTSAALFLLLLYLLPRQNLVPSVLIALGLSDGLATIWQLLIFQRLKLLSVAKDSGPTLFVSLCVVTAYYKLVETSLTVAIGTALSLLAISLLFLLTKEEKRGIWSMINRLRIRH